MKDFEIKMPKKAYTPPITDETRRRWEEGLAKGNAAITTLKRALKGGDLLFVYAAKEGKHDEVQRVVMHAAAAESRQKAIGERLARLEAKITNSD